MYCSAAKSELLALRPGPLGDWWCTLSRVGSIRESHLAIHPNASTSLSQLCHLPGPGAEPRQRLPYLLVSGIEVKFQSRPVPNQQEI